jgi:hypothetical protein
MGKGVSMPYVDYGTPFDQGNSQFFKLKSKGDKLQFRLLGAPFVEGKHFFETADGWDIQDCPRINDKAECEHCNKYFSIIAKAKKTGDESMLKQARKEAEKYKCSVSFYFPVLDRNAEKFRIFKSAQSVRAKIETEVEMGTKVLEVDFIVMRTEQPGTNYYSLTRVDSAQTKKLTEDEKLEVEKYKSINLEELISGSREEGSIAVEANSEVEDAVDKF